MQVIQTDEVERTKMDGRTNNAVRESKSRFWIAQNNQIRRGQYVYNSTV